MGFRIQHKAISVHLCKPRQGARARLHDPPPPPQTLNKAKPLTTYMRQGLRFVRLCVSIVRCMGHRRRCETPQRSSCLVQNWGHCAIVQLLSLAGTELLDSLWLYVAGTACGGLPVAKGPVDSIQA